MMQAVNDLGNLLFFVFLLTTATLTAVVAYRKARGRKTRSIAVAILLCLCAYAAVLVGVSLNSETRRLELGADKCFDDWCATVPNAFKSFPPAVIGLSCQFSLGTVRHRTDMPVKPASREFSG